MIKGNIFLILLGIIKILTLIRHDLLICFKNFKKDDPIFDFDQLKELKHIKFDNNNFNDFDWGSYERIAKTYSDKIIFFMNCHSYPVKNNWLKLLLRIMMTKV